MLPPPPRSTLFPYTTLFRSLYRDVLAHYRVVALPCRVGDPDRKGKVEAGVGHAQKTPLRGQIGRASCRERGEIGVGGGQVEEKEEKGMSESIAAIGEDSGVR